MSLIELLLVTSNGDDDQVPLDGELSSETGGETYDALFWTPKFDLLTTGVLGDESSSTIGPKKMMLYK